MARARRVVVLAVVMLAGIIGLTCAAEAPQGSPSSDDAYFEDDYGDIIGTRTTGESALSPNSVVAAPIGGPVPPGAFDTKDSTSNAASSSLQHAVAGAATAALAGFFYF